MPLRKSAIAAVFAALLVTGSALADGTARPYVESQHGKVLTLLGEAETPSRNAEIVKTIDALLDYDAIAAATLGKPCPAALPSCVDHWSALTDTQRAEAAGLVKKLVQKNYRKNVIKTADYAVTFAQISDDGGAARIRTTAKSKKNPREAEVLVDYVLRKVDGQWKVVDYLALGTTSMTKGYYDRFHGWLADPALGYAHFVKKMNEAIAK